MLLLADRRGPLGAVLFAAWTGVAVVGTFAVNAAVNAVVNAVVNAPAVRRYYRRRLSSS